MVTIPKMLYWLKQGFKVRRPSWEKSAYLVLRGDHIVNDRGENVKFDNINSLAKTDYELYEESRFCEKCGSELI